MNKFKNKKIVLLGGLHRSGTSILHEILRGQNDISGFKNTGVPEDEGQHLQTVVPPAWKFGGPGLFGLNQQAYINEKSKLLNKKNKDKILQEWSPYWDLNKEFLMEKSPPNLIRTTFLQALFFPQTTYFIIIIRHPVAVSLATKKWKPHIPFENLIEHWLFCHEIFLKDKPKISNLLCLKYENLITNPQLICEQISDFLKCPIFYNNQIENHNIKYFKEWKEKYQTINFEIYEPMINLYGYSFYGDYRIN